jgi:hypothetical protein
MICHRPFTGVVYDKNSEIGPFVEYNLAIFVWKVLIALKDIAQRKDLVAPFHNRNPDIQGRLIKELQDLY